ncbi:hypothetical protein NKR23_g6132 [Pleurostoma richardsiae]|uniref:Uncharacterized protein n=1 Tax=Pleurostoma richardsiae TaxID=41990 RepID=A0AA38RXA9_9PEZI|nr:hypothetical protein NKR23_g6132 [Pleurostoma richardsiae]
MKKTLFRTLLLGATSCAAVVLPGPANSSDDSLMINPQEDFPLSHQFFDSSKYSWPDTVNDAAQYRNAGANRSRIIAPRDDYQGFDDRVFGDDGWPINFHPENLPSPETVSFTDLYKPKGGPYKWHMYKHYCGNFGTGAHVTMHRAAEDLMEGYEPFIRCKAAARSCERIWCYDTTAVWLCNDNDEPIDISCYNVGWMGQLIDELCCVHWQGFGITNQKGSGGKSGQIFHPEDNYNVIIGYANCRTPNHPPYAVGVGNNNKCLSLRTGATCTDGIVSYTE